MLHKSFHLSFIPTFPFSCCAPFALLSYTALAFKLCTRMLLWISRACSSMFSVFVEWTPRTRCRDVGKNGQCRQYYLLLVIVRFTFASRDWISQVESSCRKMPLFLSWIFPTSGQFGLSSLPPSITYARLKALHSPSKDLITLRNATRLPHRSLRVQVEHDARTETTSLRCLLGYEGRV